MCKLFVAVFMEENTDAKVQKEYDDKKSYMSPLSSLALVVSAGIIPVLGGLPYNTMNHLADMGQGFMGVFHAGHEVHYFTWINLKGSLISIGIGLCVYVFVVRGLLMEKQPDGTKVYVNRWPLKLDLEELLYRPVLLKLIPFICGGICNVLDHITDIIVKILLMIGSFVAGFCNIITDGIVVFLRKTVYRDSHYISVLEEGNEVTHVFGGFLNDLEYFFNETIWKDHPRKRDFEHWLALKGAAFKENMVFIGRSLSYGLILFCLGFSATLIYLLISAVL